MNEKRIIVTVNGTPLDAEAGTRIGDLLARDGLIGMPCGGHGKCGKCRVTAKGQLAPPTENERQLLTPEELDSGVRLACCAVALGDCTVTAREEDGAANILSDGDLPPIRLDPAFARYGVAVDIGTTTLAARLYDRRGNLLAAETALNPESRFGADVISRMEASLAGQRDAIAAVIRSAVDDLTRRMADTAGIDPREIDGMVITGNTVMLYLLTREDVEPLTHAPFDARRLFGEVLTARELGLEAAGEDAAVYLPPCTAAFLGADINTALLASGICDKEGTHVLVDIGTNGEMMLRRGDRLYACSTAAGPAFEGAGISMGMGGKPGAIDRVKIGANGALEAHVIGGGEPVGICGSGLVDAVACLLEGEVMDETGALDDDPTLIREPVSLTQQDIRAVQLAKSAIHAGMRTLLKTAGVPSSAVDSLEVAGGFGSYLDIRSATAIGLLPEELGGRVKILGNAALAGAAMLLLSKGLRETCRRRAGEAEIVPLASNPVFVSEYMERMLF